jgi:hypothetical protein
VLHFLKLTESFFDDFLALVLNELVCAFKLFLCDFGVFLDLFHECICELCHVFLGLHDLLIHNDRGYVSHNQKLVCAAGDLNVDLIKSDVLWDISQKVIQWIFSVLSGSWHELEYGSFFIIHQKLPD